MAKPKNKNFVLYLIILAVVIVAVLFYVFYVEKIQFSPLQAELTSLEKEQIVTIKQQIVQQGTPEHPDYTPLYNFLSEKKGDLNKIKLVCEDFDKIYCLKWACKENLDLREKLAAELEIEIRELYEGKVEQEKVELYIQGHKEDCMLGIPQFVY